MATTSQIRICPTCQADLGEVPKGKPCPECHSDAIVHLDKRREFYSSIEKKGFTEYHPISMQLKDKIKKILVSTRSAKEKEEDKESARKEAVDLLAECPSQIKKFMAEDLILCLNHRVIESLGIDTKAFIATCKKIGKLAENLDEYVNLNKER